jgi:phosphocarrier protein
MIKQQIEIINQLGLHARASSKLVSLANNYKSSILLTKDNKQANAKSIMAVMMLAANKGSIIHIIVDGEDEDPC